MDYMGGAYIRYRFPEPDIIFPEQESSVNFKSVYREKEKRCKESYKGDSDTLLYWDNRYNVEEIFNYIIEDLADTDRVNEGLSSLRSIKEEVNDDIKNTSLLMIALGEQEHISLDGWDSDGNQRYKEVFRTLNDMKKLKATINECIKYIINERRNLIKP